MFTQLKQILTILINLQPDQSRKNNEPIFVLSHNHEGAYSHNIKSYEHWYKTYISLLAKCRVGTTQSQTGIAANNDVPQPVRLRGFF